MIQEIGKKSGEKIKMEILFYYLFTSSKYSEILSCYWTLSLVSDYFFMFVNSCPCLPCWHPPSPFSKVITEEGRKRSLRHKHVLWKTVFCRATAEKGKISFMQVCLQNRILQLNRDTRKTWYFVTPKKLLSLIKFHQFSILFHIFWNVYSQINIF